MIPSERKKQEKYKPKVTMDYSYTNNGQIVNYGEIKLYLYVEDICRYKKNSFKEK